MSAFYNEHDPYAAEWLRNLIAAGHIATGVVDERDIRDIEPWELRGFAQCHFFAGIGVWSHALRQAGWSDDQPIWTGSCPCQPFSNAGQRKGFSDDRHLWPAWAKLLGVCRPPVVIGEQVASKDGLGWVDLVSADLEASGYAFGASDLCAAGFEESHLRQRLYFVALADDDPGLENRHVGHGSVLFPQGRQEPGRSIGLRGTAGRMADTPSEQHDWGGSAGTAGGPEYSDGGSIGRMEYPDLPRQHERAPGREQSLHNSDSAAVQGSTIRDPGQIAGRWLDADWLLCRNPAGEPSWRPVEPGTFPLAHGVASRMGKLRAYGNALDAKTAIGFCEVVAEITGV